MWICGYKAGEFQLLVALQLQGGGVKAQRYGEATIIRIDLGSTPKPRIPVANEGLGWDSLLKM